MKIVKKDSYKAEKEKIEKEKKKLLEEQRREYLERLVRQKKFQTFVIEGIIKKNLEALTDIRNIPNAETQDAEKVGRLVVQAKAARATLEKILGDLLNF